MHIYLSHSGDYEYEKELYSLRFVMAKITAHKDTVDLIKKLKAI